MNPEIYKHKKKLKTDPQIFSALSKYFDIRNLVFLPVEHINYTKLGPDSHGSHRWGGGGPPIVVWILLVTQLILTNIPPLGVQLRMTRAENEGKRRG